MRFLLLLASILLLPVPADGSLADTVGWTGGCTCVVIHRDGWALTAEHCGHDGEFTVEIAGRKVIARKVYEPPKNRIDEVVLIKLDGGPFAWADVAPEPVKAGESVSAWGFPSGKLTFSGGKVSTVSLLVNCDFQIWEGNSGGPLFNQAGQVVGIASTRNPVPGEWGYSGQGPGSHWIGMPAIRKALSYAQFQPDQKKPVVWVVTASWCGLCQTFHDDIKAGKYPGVRFEDADVDTALGKQKVAEIQAATGRKIPSLPTLWPEGSTVLYPVGSKQNTVGTWDWLKKTLRLPLTIVEDITGDRQREPVPGEPLPPELFQPPPELKPIPQGDGLVPEPTEPDYAGVRLLLFAPQTGAHDLPAKAVLALAEHAGQQLSEHTEDRARFVMVSERITPARYAATCEAANVPPGQWQFIAMIPARSDGMRQKIRGALLGFIRDSLPESVRNAPLGLLTETGSKDAYPATVAALSTPEPPPAPEDPVEGGDPESDQSPLTLLAGWIVGTILNLMGVRKK